MQAAIGEAQRRSRRPSSPSATIEQELADGRRLLNALNEGAVALADKVDKSQIKSPVRGCVQRLLANTVGGVVQPGKDIVEIVPLDDALVLEARIQPKDIAFIAPGQAATVKFSAYDFSIYGGMDAEVENISPDTVVDEKGNAFYLDARAHQGRALQRQAAHHPRHDRRGRHPHRQPSRCCLPAQAGAQGQGLTRCANADSAPRRPAATFALRWAASGRNPITR